MKEIEFKTLLSKEDYEKLLTYFEIKEEDIKEQINYYFDTADFNFYKKKEIVRIRKKKAKYELTRKQKGENKYTNLETNKDISKEEFLTYLKTGIVVEGQTLEYKTELKTKRAEFKYKDTIVAIDKNEYQNKVDYELEMEVKDLEKGEEIFNELLDRLKIKKGVFKRKIERAFSEILTKE